MGVLLTTAVIAVSVAVGIWAERRRPDAVAYGTRRALTFVLYVLIPPVVFFNLAASSLDVDHALGILLGLVSVGLTAVFAGLVASRGLKLSRPQVGSVVCAVLAINSAYLGYPLTVALLGRDELSTAVLFDVLVCAPSLLLGAFAVGAAFGTGRERPRASASAPSSPATRRSTRRSPACWRRRRWPRTSSSTSHRPW